MVSLKVCLLKGRPVLLPIRCRRCSPCVNNNFGHFLPSETGDNSIIKLGQQLGALSEDGIEETCYSAEIPRGVEMRVDECILATHLNEYDTFEKFTFLVTRHSRICTQHSAEGVLSFPGWMARNG